MEETKFAAIIRYFGTPDPNTLHNLVMTHQTQLYTHIKTLKCYIYLEDNQKYYIKPIGLGNNPLIQIVNHNRAELNVSVLAYMYLKNGIHLKVSTFLPTVHVTIYLTSVALENPYFPLETIYHLYEKPSIQGPLQVCIEPHITTLTLENSTPSPQSNIGMNEKINKSPEILAGKTQRSPKEPLRKNPSRFQNQNPRKVLPPPPPMEKIPSLMDISVELPKNFGSKSEKFGNDGFGDSQNKVSTPTDTINPLENFQKNRKIQYFKRPMTIGKFRFDPPQSIHDPAQPSTSKQNVPEISQSKNLGRNYIQHSKIPSFPPKTHSFPHKPCDYCGSLEHWPVYCPVRRTMDSRIKFINNPNRWPTKPPGPMCMRCLKLTHKAEECLSDKVCGCCSDKMHHTSICGYLPIFYMENENNHEKSGKNSQEYLGNTYTPDILDPIMKIRMEVEKLKNSEVKDEKSEFDLEMEIDGKIEHNNPKPSLLSSPIPEKPSVKPSPIPEKPSVKLSPISKNLK